MKKFFFAVVLQVVFIVAAVVANINALSVAWIVGFACLILACLWFAGKAQGEKWSSVLSFTAIAGVLTAIVTGICALTGTKGMDPFSFVALGEFLISALVFLLMSLPITDNETPKHLIYSLIACVSFACAGWFVTGFETLVCEIPQGLEKVLQAFGFMSFGYFILSLLCFFYTSFFGSCRR